MMSQHLFSKDFMKQLEQDLKKSIEDDAKKHPQKFLDNHVGNAVPGVCTKCGQPQMVIVKGGKARCSGCGYTTKLSVDLNWR